MVQAASREAYHAFRQQVDGALARQAARSQSLACLARLADRFTSAWSNGCEGRIRSGAATADLTSPISAALPTLAAFQRFRARATSLEPVALEAFGVLRGYQDRLRLIAITELDGVVRRTLRREWLKARKAAAEEHRPELLLERDEIERRVTRLAKLDDEMRRLNKSLLATDLQIHYRSRYRELIDFSNAAYYRSALSVPARHPDDEVRRARPIHVVRADGLYEAQTNPIEATRVVDELAAIWAQPANRPSTGVVTFNRKQADLVEEAVSLRAAADDAFRRALEEERARQQDGEDMGFFVKNLENVQGDERDVILFSTTFGRDRHGTFRRNFGVLGQAGGERRLNVAVTRAREKVVLVTSMPVRQISDWSDATRMPEKPRDYLQAYLDYASKVSSGDLALARNLAPRLGTVTRPAARADRVGPDGFEQSVAQFIEGLGYQLVAAPSSDDAFGLDFAIINPATGLFGIGIECDAPRHPLLEKARGREIWRRRVLQRAVPSIYRVWSREWYERNAEERARLKQAIEAAIEKREAA